MKINGLWPKKPSLKSLLLFLVYVIMVLMAMNSCKTFKMESTIDRPNSVLINVDDLSWKDLRFMESTYDQTPNWDVFAEQGMIFTNAHAGAASKACLPSGLNTLRHGVYTVGPSDRCNERTRRLIPIKNTKHLHDSIHTFPEMLKSAGYVTANFGKWHVDHDPTKQGIDLNVGGGHYGNPSKDGCFSPYDIDFIQDGPDGDYLTDRLT